MSELQDIHRLQAFVTVVEEGSLSAATKKLHITQPALSSRLKILEESLNCVLLERTGKGVFPTQMGKLVYNHAIQIIKNVVEMQNTVARHLDLKEGWVHLAGGSTAVFGIFPQAIQNFREKYPEIKFTLNEVDLSIAIQNVKDSIVDLAIITKNPFDVEKNDDPFSSVKIHTTISDELVLVASKKHPLSINSKALIAINKNILPMHLNRQHMILPEEGTLVREMVDAEFRNLCIKPHIVMTLKSPHNILQMVEKNIGISFVSKLLLKNNENIDIIPIEYLSLKRELVVIGSQDKTLTPVSQKFLEFLLQTNTGL